MKRWERSEVTPTIALKVPQRIVLILATLHGGQVTVVIRNSERRMIHHNRLRRTYSGSIRYFPDTSLSSERIIPVEPDE